MSACRAIETPEVQRDHLEEDRQRRAASRANETTEQREAHVEENRINSCHHSYNQLQWLILCIKHYHLHFNGVVTGWNGYPGCHS
ncbi:hypothetical protein AVEN_45081-1 [Araneus ventricosus]|uniref:Uncharacterized protein n=1 Tax=Araneus ventricosus TaxID=182803 RepID=A0A4Y2FRQ9_ARAVE|nr:hypothetical protein AVEN_45081-1 [Araneus ventricosus]